MINFKKGSYVAVKNILSDDAAWEGTLKFTSNVKVDGKGSGVIESTADVIVGEHADLNADIKAENVIISGKITGNITVEGQFCLTKTGCLKGNVKASSVVIEDGAYFAGISESAPREARAEEKAQAAGLVQETAEEAPVQETEADEKAEVPAYVKPEEKNAKKKKDEKAQ